MSGCSCNGPGLGTNEDFYSAPKDLYTRVDWSEDDGSVQGGRDGKNFTDIAPPKDFPSQEDLVRVDQYLRGRILSDSSTDAIPSYDLNVYVDFVVPTDSVENLQTDEGRKDLISVPADLAQEDMSQTDLAREDRPQTDLVQEDVSQSDRPRADFPQEDMSPPDTLPPDLGWTDLAQEDMGKDTGVLLDAADTAAQPPDLVADSNQDGFADMTADAPAIVCEEVNWCEDLQNTEILLDNYFNCQGYSFSIKIEEEGNERRVSVIKEYPWPERHEYYLFLNSGALSNINCYVSGQPINDAGTTCNEDEYLCPSDEGYNEELQSMLLILSEAYEKNTDGNYCALEEEREQIFELTSCIQSVLEENGVYFDAETEVSDGGLTDLVTNQ